MPNTLQKIQIGLLQNYDGKSIVLQNQATGEFVQLEKTQEPILKSLNVLHFKNEPFNGRFNLYEYGNVDNINAMVA